MLGCMWSTFIQLYQALLALITRLKPSQEIAQAPTPPEIPLKPQPAPQTPQPTQPIAPGATPAAYSYPKLEAFIAEIKNMEGWEPGSTSFTHNNPGNLRCQPGNMNILATKCEDGFCYFPTAEKGMQALRNVTRSTCVGASVTYNTEAQKVGLKSAADLNLYQYFRIRDPRTDGNDPDALAERFGRVLSVDPTTFTMRELLS